MTKEREYDAIAEWYDVLWPKMEDISFYSDLAQRHGSPILELGCGTGRIACELAEKGYRVLGIDVSSGMLQRANARKATIAPQTASSVEFQRASMTEFDFAERFGLIMVPFSAILELGGSKERLATYQCCVRHLAGGGVLAFDNWFRGTGRLAHWGGKPRPQKIITFSGIHFHPTKANIMIHHFEAQDYGSDGRMELTLFLDQVGNDGSVRRQTLTLLRHYVSPEETAAELQTAGFADIEVYGGFGREPLYDSALNGRGRQIFLARLRK